MSAETPPGEEGMSVEVVGDRLVITIGLDVLAGAASTHGVRVTDKYVFAREVAQKLECFSSAYEQETTVIEACIDDAINDAVQDGCDGVVDIPEDNNEEEPAACPTSETSTDESVPGLGVVI